MSKLKNKIKTTLKEVTAEELGDTLNTMKSQVKTELPSAEPEEIEDIVGDALGVANDNTNFSKITEFDDDAIGRGIGDGMNPEADGLDYEKLSALVADINQDSSTELPTELPSDDTGVDELPFEGVNPRMSKNELMESILNRNKSKVIKIVKVKDIKNGK